MSMTLDMLAALDSVATDLGDTVTKPVAKKATNKNGHVRVTIAPCHVTTVSRATVDAALAHETAFVGFTELHHSGSLELLRESAKTHDYTVYVGTSLRASNGYPSHDCPIAVHKSYKVIEHGAEKISPKTSGDSRGLGMERWATWAVANTNVGTTAYIATHFNAGVLHPNIQRSQNYSTGVKNVRALIRRLLVKYGPNLHIILTGDLNLGLSNTGLPYWPGHMFNAVGMQYTVFGNIIWVAHKNLTVTDSNILGNLPGSDHPHAVYTFESIK